MENSPLVLFYFILFYANSGSLESLKRRASAWILIRGGK